MVQRELDNCSGRPSESVSGLMQESWTAARAPSRAGSGAGRGDGSRRFADGFSSRADGPVRASAGSLPFCFQGKLAAGVLQRQRGPGANALDLDGLVEPLAGPLQDDLDSLLGHRLAEVPLDEEAEAVVKLPGCQPRVVKIRRLPGRTERQPRREATWRPAWRVNAENLGQAWTQVDTCPPLAL